MLSGKKTTAGFGDSGKATPQAAGTRFVRAAPIAGRRVAQRALARLLGSCSSLPYVDSLSL
jgi:hypothetical protein